MNNKDIGWVYINILTIKRIMCYNSMDIPGRFYLQINYEYIMGKNTTYITDRMVSEQALLIDMQIINNLITN